MGGFLTTVLAGVATIAGIYLAIHYATNVQTEAGGVVSSFSKVESTFQGGPGL